jgi:hypothetical protein
MSPLIRRKITVDISTTFGKQTHDHTFYVRPRDVEPGDVIIKPEEMNPEVLADLARTHPKEFARDAVRLGVLQLDENEDPFEPVIDEDEDDEEPGDQFTPEQTEFLALEAKDAIAKIEAIDENDVDALAALFEAEISRPRARKTVLEAFAAKGMQ